MHILAADLDPQQTYKLITGVVVPRPIAWVCTRSPEGVLNVAPFSAFTFVSNKPPMLGINVGRKAGVRKDTGRNIHANGEYVVHICDDSFVEAIHESAVEHPPEVSEVELLGLEVAPSRCISVPRLLAPPVAMECRVERILRVGRSGGHLVLGEAVFFHVRRDLWVGGQVSPEGFRPVARLGSTAYAKMGEIFHSPRPDWRAILEGHAGGTVHDP